MIVAYVFWGTFEQWLESLTEEDSQAIKVVSMDMWDAYRQAVGKRLRHAKIVTDRFHVMKQINHQIDLMRRSMQRKAKKESDEALYQALKGSQWVLLKNRSTLAPEQEAQLQTILAVSDELRIIYLLKEEFRTICDKINDQTRAQRFLWAWTGKALVTGSRYLTRFVNTLRNWWHEFLNYFDDRVTQGFVEGINRAIRGIINRALFDPTNLCRVGVRRRSQLIISTLSVPVWLFAIGGPFDLLYWYRPALGAIALPLYTLILPIISRSAR